MHRLKSCHAVDAVGMVGGQRVADDVPGVMADDGEPLVAEGVHERDEVVRQCGGVVAVLRLVGQPDPALVDGDDLEPFGPPTAAYSSMAADCTLASMAIGVMRYAAAGRFARH